MTIFHKSTSDECYVAYIINGKKYKDAYVYYNKENSEYMHLIYYDGWMDYEEIDLPSDNRIAKYFIIAAFNKIEIN